MNFIKTVPYYINFDLVTHIDIEDMRLIVNFVNHSKFYINLKEDKDIIRETLEGNKDDTSMA